MKGCEKSRQSLSMVRMNYFFSDFTEENYRVILQMAKNKYRFHSYNDADSMNKGIIWRHDIDASINRAESLSEIEKEEGVFSTWFVLLHSEYYNAFEKEMRNKLMRIKENGGIIGLHFDPGYYNLSNKDIVELENKLLFEKSILENIVEQEIGAFSFHNPDVNGGFMNLEQFDLAGMINVYHERIRKNFRYCSDSNGYWRFERLQDVIQNGKEDERLHILTHPAMWQKEVMPPRARVQRCVDGRARNVMSNYDKFLEINSRDNIS